MSRVKVMVAALVLLTIGLILSGCTVVHKGVVEDKSYTPMSIQTTFISCGKGMCPITQVYPEHWDLWVCEPQGEVSEANAKRRCSWWGVSEKFYDDTDIGTAVDDGKA